MINLEKVRQTINMRQMVKNRKFIMDNNRHKQHLEWVEKNANRTKLLRAKVLVFHAIKHSLYKRYDGF